MKTRKQLFIFLMLLLCAVLLMAASCGGPAITDPCADCGKDPCECEDVCADCGKKPCACGEPCWACGKKPCECDEPWLGKGTASNPLQISTAGQLADIATVVNAGLLEEMVLGNSQGTVYLKLTKDIDLSEYSEGDGWIPIGVSFRPFKGVFDGNGKTISGLAISFSRQERLDSGTGLFGVVSGGTVKNLNIADAYIHSGVPNVGGVVGFLTNGGKIENCSFSGAVNGWMPVGGVVGRIDGGSSVTNCHAAGTVQSIGETTFTGGVAGIINSTGGGKIENCSFTGTVGGVASVGGVVGAIGVGGSVKNCYAIGTVSGLGYVGGVAGQVMNQGSLSNSYSAAAVSTSIDGYRSGGVVGLINVGGSVKDCVALGLSVTAGIYQAGRVAGDIEGTLSGSAAFSGMTVRVSGVTKTPDIGADKVDGLDLSAAAILADGTLGGRFTAANGWTVQNGKLPGFGAAVDMPAHIK
ncbi:MAG: hypothetical protein FWD39_06245 [Clostridiales bacterium]|nr:hypothetical protein [Clostridiales bacterium]